MKLLNFAIIKLTACFVLGILMGHSFIIPLKASLGATALFLLLTTLFYLRAKTRLVPSIGFGLFAFFTMISIGVLTTNLHNPKNFSNHYSHYATQKNARAQTITFKIREVLKPTPYFYKYVVDILEVDHQSTLGKSLLNIKKDSLKHTLNVDDVFTSKTQFREIPPPLNPNQFNYKDYLEKKYIYHQLVLNRNEILQVHSNRATLLGMANAIRNHINKKLEPYGFEDEELYIINALLLGQRQDISPEVYNSYAQAGVIHILAVSGLHVGLVLLILDYLFTPLGRFKHGRIAKTILLVILLWSFAIIAGLSASVTRAATMFSVVAIALNLKRPTNIYNTLAISMLIILLFKPLFLFDVGFQLSYLAVFSIVSLDPFLYKFWRPKFWVIDKLWHTLTVTVTAQLGVLPLSLFYFHQFPGLFVVTNLVIVPFLGIILGFGILVVILALINALPPFLAHTLEFIINTMNLFVNWAAKQEVFVFKDIPFSPYHVLAFYILIICLSRFLIKKNFKTLKHLLVSVLLIQTVFIYTKYNKPTNEFIVFHKSKHSIFGKTTNNKILVAHDLGNVSKKHIKSINDYALGNFIKNIEIDSIQPLYILNKKTVLVVDSLGIYNIKSFKPNYVILRQSPKINLSRLIDSIKPKQIIADGSNYISYIERWESICKKKKLPFHHTGKKGAFIIRY